MYRRWPCLSESEPPPSPARTVFGACGSQVVEQPARTIASALRNAVDLIVGRIERSALVESDHQALGEGDRRAEGHAPLLHVCIHHGLAERRLDHREHE